jgi:hypothetical protein
VFFVFDRALPTGSAGFELRYGAKRVPLTSTRNSAGDALSTWEVPADLDLGLLSNQGLLVHPVGWGDWFPIWFQLPVRPINELFDTVPSSQRHFVIDGKPLLDREGIASPSAGSTAYDRLIAHSFPGVSGYNPTPHPINDVHGVFPGDGQSVVTGVGRGWSWVSEPPKAPFKTLYACFDHRLPDAEAAAGVPSGAGWHHIGDPAETILNDLEATPLLVATAARAPVSGASWAYGLSDVAVARWLNPGEAFTTRRGNYHSFFFTGPREVCAELWVHPTVPNDAYDFAPAATEVTFKVQATTAWGEGVFVAGDDPALGNWNPAFALPLTPSAYPTWTGTASFPTGKQLSFKFLKRDGAGKVTWEAGVDRHFLTDGSSSYSGAWR